MSPIRSLSLVLFFAAVPGTALAGMPSVTVTLTDMAEIRLQNISFFLLGFLLSAFLVWRLWIYLRKQWSVLPAMSYRGALGATAIWGLVFVVVLTMISGARELMTPAAWERDGRTFKVVSKNPPTKEPAVEPTEEDRKRKLALLRDALFDYATQQGGVFPMNRNDMEIKETLWWTPHSQPYRYVYAGYPDRQVMQRMLAWEPEIFGPKRFVLFTDGTIRTMTSDEIDHELGRGYQ